MPGDPGQAYPSAVQVNEEQYVIRHQATPSEHCDCEEVDPGQNRDVVLDELLPGRVLIPLGCRLNPMAAENVANHLVR